MLFGPNWDRNDREKMAYKALEEVASEMGANLKSITSDKNA